MIISTGIFSCFFVWVFSILTFSGNFVTGSRVIDDNQIYLLKAKLETSTLLDVVIEEIK